MNIKNNHPVPGIIIIASCCLLLAGACENDDRMVTELSAKDVLLDFNASMINATATETRAVVPVEQFTGDSYTFGMSITKDNNEIFAGSGDMKATMSNPPSTSAGKWSWLFQKNSDGTEIHPYGPEGRELKVIAYYPAIEGTGAFTDGIPFDFTEVTNPRQTEILYNTDTTYTISPSGTQEATIPLRFQHAYSWIVINVTKYVNTGGDFKLSSVSIDNLSGGWIKNKGIINPKTGLVMDGAHAGPIGESRPGGESLSTTVPIQYEFLVPSFMDSGVGDGNLVISMMINGVKEVFLLNKKHLNKDGNAYGFRQGYKNTYNLAFNNSSLNLSIIDWTWAEINSSFGEPSPVSMDFRKVDMTAGPGSGLLWVESIPKSDYLNSSDHSFGSYLTTVNYGNNGIYVPVKAPSYISSVLTFNDDENVYTKEKVYPLLQITKYDISTEPISWEDEKGQLAAKELCRKYNGGGYHDWRLPRASELRALLILVAQNGNLDNLTFGSDDNVDKPYWTGTEVSDTEAWSIYYHYEKGKNRGPMIFPQNKKIKGFVRCVRDAPAS